MLFYGLVNTRRRPIIDALLASGLRCAVHDQDNPVFGEERDALIGRSQIVLNVHFHDLAIFEVFRCFYPLLNGRCVVSETGSGPNEACYRDATVFAPYDALVETCLRYAHDAVLLGEQEARAAAALARFRMAEVLIAVLEST